MRRCFCGLGEFLDAVFGALRQRPLLGVLLYVLLLPLAELLFFFHTRHYLRVLNRTPHRTHDAEADHRDVLEFWMLLSHSEPEAVKALVQGWFQGEGPVRRGDVQELIAWTLYNADVEQLDAAQKLFVSELLLDVEEVIGGVYKPGSAKTLHCMRHTLDPLEEVHKPLAFYLAVLAAQGLAAAVLRLRGFVLLECDGLRYYFRSGRVGHDRCQEESEEVVPLVVMHGVGGLPLYVWTIFQLCRSVPSAHMLVPIFDQCRIRIPLVDDSPLPTKQLMAALQRMVYRHSSRPATFVAHSMGSAFLAALLRAHPVVVSSAVFVDPVCFLLYRYPVLYNFLYRRSSAMQALKDPREWPKVLLRKVISTEPSMQCCFRKDFWWSQYWLHPTMLTCDAAVLLSGSDVIVPAQQVQLYLLEYLKKQSANAYAACMEQWPRNQEPKRKFLHSARLRVELHEGFDHGFHMLLPRQPRGVVEAVLWVRGQGRLR